MAHRLDNYVIQGEISNLCRNSITGRLEVLRAHTVNGRTVIRPALLLLSLTGNLSSSLIGHSFRFSLRHPLASAVKPLPDFFHSEQIGVISDSLLRLTALPTDANSEDWQHTLGFAVDPSKCHQNASLYLQWHSQNGTVALELLDSLIKIDRIDSLPFSPTDENSSDTVATSLFPPTVSSFLNSDDTCFEIVADSPTGAGESMAESAAESDNDDHFQLFHPDLEDQIRQSATEYPDSSPTTTSLPRRRWEEIIPGIDPETKRLYETWDEVLGGEKDEPLTLLFDEPLCLPTPASLQNETQAWQVLTQLLQAMALRGVAFDMCHHISAKEAYRLLIEELLPEAGVHPGLVDTGFICHFGTAEFCPHCQSEFESSP